MTPERRCDERAHDRGERQGRGERPPAGASRSGRTTGSVRNAWSNASRRSSMSSNRTAAAPHFRSPRRSSLGIRGRSARTPRSASSSRCTGTCTSITPRSPTMRSWPNSPRAREVFEREGSPDHRVPRSVPALERRHAARGPRDRLPLRREPGDGLPLGRRRSERGVSPRPRLLRRTACGGVPRRSLDRIGTSFASRTSCPTTRRSSIACA